MDNEISSSFDLGQLPYSLDAEQAVLGSILLDPSCLSAVAVLLKPDSFYLPQHRAIYSTILNIDSAGGNIDPLIVLEQLKQISAYDDAGGKAYLLQLASNVPSTANVESYAKIIVEKYYIRALINASKEIIESASSEEQTANVLLDSAEQKIYSIRQGKTTSGPAKLGEIITGEVYDSLQKLSSSNKSDHMGIPTGFSDLDKMIVGLNKSDLILIGARPAMGKTSFALNIARNIAVVAKRKVLFFSLEMSNEQLAKRVFATEARVESTKMRNGEISANEWTRLATAASCLNNCELYFDDTSNVTVPEMKAKIRRLRDVDCVIIDYLQLMQSARKTENRVQEITEITRSLKLMAKDLNIPIVVCSQLSRGTEMRGQKHRPQLADLRESGSIEQDADIVLMLYRELYYDKDKEDNPENISVNDAQVLVRKNRHGETGDVDVVWNPDFTLFSNKERMRNDR